MRQLADNLGATPRLLVDHAGAYKGMGDVVCETAFYPALRRRFPGAHIASRQGRTLAWGHPDVDAFDETTPEAEFDAVLRVPSMGEFLARLRDPALRERHVVDHFLAAVGLPEAGTRPSLHVLPAEMEALGLEDDGQEGLIVAYSADSKEFDRRWGQERFLELLADLEATYGLSLIELGNGTTAGHVGLGLDLVGQTSLRQTMAVLSLADLFIGNHGGLTHLAGGVGTPILCPWGASAPYASYAYDEWSVAIETAPACRHCIWTGVLAPGCRSLDPLTGRSACTQEITVDRMRRAADALVPALIRDRERLRARRAALREVARDPRGLAQFEHHHRVSPDSNMHLYLGAPEGWGGVHSPEGFRRLKQVVAFPDWLDPACRWDRLIATYLEVASPEDPWVLVLTAGLLTGPEVRVMLVDYLTHLRPARPLPKIMVVTGALGFEERCWLVERGHAYVELGGVFELPPAACPATPRVRELAPGMLDRL